MIELWEKGRAVSATGEITRTLGRIAAGSFSYSDKAGKLEAARILQQTWDDCVQAFGETNPDNTGRRRPSRRVLEIS